MCGSKSGRALIIWSLIKDIYFRKLVNELVYPPRNSLIFHQNIKFLGGWNEYEKIEDATFHSRRKG